MYAADKREINTILRFLLPIKLSYVGSLSFKASRDDTSISSYSKK